MKAEEQIELFDLINEITKDREKAKRIVTLVSEAQNEKVGKPEMETAIEKCKVDLIKWMLVLWLTQMAAIIGLYLKK